VEFDVLGSAEYAKTDVGVFSADRLTPELIAALRRWAGETDAPAVLVVNEIDETELRAVVKHRVVSVLPRHAATAAQLANSVLEAASVRTVIPPHRAGELLRHGHKFQRSQEDEASVLTARELDVLRLMAEGMGTAQIAQELRYSERSVKNIIYGITQRLKLRNRSHAVAYAIRAGVI
jgi:DNA-binding NarL/FixJ family response regulator